MGAVRRFRLQSSLPLVMALLSIAVMYGPVFAGRVPFPVAFIYFFPLFAPDRPQEVSLDVPDIGDLATQFYEYRTLSSKAVADGALPKWNPYILSGTTFVGNPLSALFYPPNALYYVLPVAAAWTFGFLLRTLLCILFTASFLRRIGATPTAAVVSGLLYTFSGFMTVWQGQSMPDTAIWLPLICYAVVRLHDDPSIRSVVVLTFAFVMPALSGHPETMAHITLVGAGLAVFIAPQRPVAAKSTRTAKFLSLFATAGLLSLGISAIQLIPSVEWFQNVYRGLDVTWPSAPSWSLLGIVSRDIAGSINSFGLLIPLQASYVGMMAFVAAPVALLSRPRRYVVFFFALAALSMCIAYGIGPVLEVVHQIPFLKTLKHDRLILLVTFAMSVLTGLGVSVVEDLTEHPDRKRATRVGLLTAAGLWVAVQLIYTVSVLTITAPKNRMGHIFISLFFVLLSAAVVFAAVSFRRGTPWFRLGVLLVVCADVYTFAYGFIPFASPRQIFPPNELFSRLSAMDPSPFRISQLGYSFATNSQMIYGLHESDGYEIPLTRIRTFAEGISPAYTDAVVMEAKPILESNDRRADLLNTKYYVVLQELPEYPKFLQMPDRFRFLFEYRKASVFENLRAMPGAFLVPASGIQVVKDSGSQMKILKEPSFNPQTTVILDEPVTPPKTSNASPAQGAQVSMFQRKTNELQMRVDTDQESILVISQTYYPGWKAYIDGESTPVFPANYALTGVSVGRGSHDVRLSFEPESLKVGILVSLATLTIVVVLLAFQRRREVLLSDS